MRTTNPILVEYYCRTISLIKLKIRSVKCSYKTRRHSSGLLLDEIILHDAQVKIYRLLNIGKQLEHRSFAHRVYSF